VDGDHRRYQRFERGSEGKLGRTNKREDRTVVFREIRGWGLRKQGVCWERRKYGDVFEKWHSAECG